MLVYRVEDDEGFGPYNGRRATEWRTYEITMRHNGPSHPTGYEDNIDDTDYEVLFGFDCEDKFRRWFNADEARRLCEAGFTLATYDVDPDAVLWGDSRKQVVFDPERARKVADRSPLKPHQTVQ